jgi:hypothetical protein
LSNSRWRAVNGTTKCLRRLLARFSPGSPGWSQRWLPTPPIGVGERPPTSVCSAARCDAWSDSTSAAVGHIFQLEMVMSSHGFSLPTRPQVLKEFYVEAEDEDKEEETRFEKSEAGLEELRYGRG